MPKSWCPAPPILATSLGENIPNRSSAFHRSAKPRFAVLRADTRPAPTSPLGDMCGCRTNPDLGRARGPARTSSLDDIARVFPVRPPRPGGGLPRRCQNLAIRSHPSSRHRLVKIFPIVRRHSHRSAKPRCAVLRADTRPAPTSPLGDMCGRRTNPDHRAGTGARPLRLHSTISQEFSRAATTPRGGLPPPMPKSCDPIPSRPMHGIT